jgi:RHS repeat-associated protein
MKIGTEYYWYHNDHLGTPQKLTTTSGAVVWSAKYTSFGKASVDTASSITNPMRFAGQYYDHETGLHYNYHRYYDPKLGRYLRADPAHSKHDELKKIPFTVSFFQKNPQAFNTYSYAGNSPIVNSDPFGLFTVEGDCKGKKNSIKAGAEKACKNIDKTITCPKLAACIKKRCEDSKIKCVCCDNPNGLGYNWSFLGIPSKNIHVCSNHKHLTSKIGGVVIHEWAHSCGWDHGEGCGVPGGGGTI